MDLPGQQPGLLKGIRIESAAFAFQFRQVLPQQNGADHQEFRLCEAFIQRGVHPLPDILPQTIGDVAGGAVIGGFQIVGPQHEHHCIQGLVGHEHHFPGIKAAFLRHVGVFAHGVPAVETLFQDFRIQIQRSGPALFLPVAVCGGEAPGVGVSEAENSFLCQNLCPFHDRRIVLHQDVSRRFLCRASSVCS